MCQRPLWSANAPKGRLVVAIEHVILNVVSRTNCARSNSGHSDTMTSKTLTITKTWDSQPLVADKFTNVTLAGVRDVNGHVTGLQVNVSAPFYNDPPPPGPAGSKMGLWDYEVVEAFFLGTDDRYLEVEFGPFGHYIILMLNGAKNCIKHSIPVDYQVTSRQVGGQWTGTAVIPLDYLPPNLIKINSYAIHGLNETREYMAFNPVPSGQFRQPDFHRLDYFVSFDYEQLIPVSSDLSPLWQEAIANPQC
ncbi:UPF0462 protein C4orf33 -like protein [Halotydeus destructor]|nr:UPF0462 protein C4orf33 -like protein [Halotydeus destructor]